MKYIYVLLANGFEEIEALTPVDVLRRVDLNVILTSTSGKLDVVGAHNITVKCDKLIEDIVFDNKSMIILPGGMPGTSNLLENELVKNAITLLNEKELPIAAICAAPMILGEMGFLVGKKATCFPGFEKYLTGSIKSNNLVETDGNIITARGMGVAMDFSLEIVKYLLGEEKMRTIAKAMIVEKYL